MSLLAGKDVKALSEVNVLHSSSALLRGCSQAADCFLIAHHGEGRYSVNYCCWKHQLELEHAPVFVRPSPPGEQ